MTATPAKAKAFLARIKESVVDKEMEVSLETLFLTLLCLEIFQRGVVVTDEAPQDTAKILEAVRSVAGKSLLTANDTGGLPKPLLAGSSGIQGKLAEAIVSRLDDLEAPAFVSEFRQQSMNKQAVSPIIQRCQDVNDQRILVLIKLWDEENSCSVSDNGDTNTVLAVNLLALAEGSYYRAASFQPDAPPMWKRAWETHSERQRRRRGQVQTENQEELHWVSWGSIPALEALRRIIKAKGNARRASELSLHLTSAWLDATQHSLQKSSGPQSPSFTTKIEQAFVEPYRSMPLTDFVPDKTIAKVHKNLAEVVVSPEQMSLEDLFLCDILSLEVLHMENQVGIRQSIQDMEQQAKNRSSSLTSSQIEDKARETFFLSRLDDGQPPNDYEKANKFLQQLFAMDPETPGATQTKARAFAALYKFLSDQREAALAIQKSKKKSDTIVQECWYDLGKFVLSSISNYSSLTTIQAVQSHLATASVSERGCFEMISNLVSQVSWMTFSSHVKSSVAMPFETFAFEFANFVSSILSEEKRQEAAKTMAAAVSGKSRLEEQQYMNLRHVQFTSKCWLLLHQESLSSPSILDITNGLLSLLTTNEALIELDAYHGCTFLGALLSWSGLFRTPWEFCILPEARNMVQRARRMLKQAILSCNRKPLAIEEILLDVAEADAEVSGLKDRACQLYQRTLGSALLKENHAALVYVRARCYLGLARIADDTATDWAGKGLKELQAMSPDEGALFIWKNVGIQNTSLSFQIALSRHLIAGNLVAVGRFQEAGEFLQEAVKDAPTDQLASFSLGAFLLRMVFFHGHNSPEAQKAAQTQLLKAAKLDANKPGPFALLGYWYESKNDVKRSVGCFSKALVLDPSHPVAGRGMIRLADDATREKIIQRAITFPASLNGWAWLSIGISKAKLDGEDEIAVSALLKATRARDIEKPSSDSLSIFYSGPSRPSEAGSDELTTGLLELSACYRRLGRCSAELRTLQTALDISGEYATWSLLHACAQSEMEMGLVEDSKSKFARAALESSGSRSKASAFGQGLACFMMGRRDLQDGKAGVALKHIQEGIDFCEPLAEDSCSLSKLVGDMYSFLSAFPSELLADNASSDHLEAHLQIISRGIHYYSSALDKVKSLVESSVNEMHANLVCDSAVNLLLQAQLAACSLGLSGNKCASDQTLLDSFHRARDRFSDSLRLDPLCARAWCGYGCSLVDDAVKAQHAFSRAIELDSASPDSYANLGFLYIESRAFSASAETCDKLIQVADTPMSWINQALQLEKKALERDSRFAADESGQISDAYRAALQIQKEPFALVGLAASFRLAAAAKGGSKTGEWENKTLSSEYYSITSKSAPGTVEISLDDETLGAVDDTERSSSLATKRSIIIDPRYGEAWLSVAKQLVVEQSDSMTERDLNSAKVAIQRANSILLGRLTEENSTVGEHAHVAASDLSSSLSLDSWLDGENGTSSSVKKAQLALLVCPQNSLARQVLGDRVQLTEISV